MYTGRIIGTESLFQTAKALGVTTLSNLLIKCNYASNSLLVSEDHADFLLHQCRKYYQTNRFTDVAIHCEVMDLRLFYKISL